MPTIYIKNTVIAAPRRRKHGQQKMYGREDTITTRAGCHCIAVIDTRPLTAGHSQTLPTIYIGIGSKNTMYVNTITPRHGIDKNTSLYRVGRQQRTGKRCTSIPPPSPEHLSPKTARWQNRMNRRGQKYPQCHTTTLRASSHCKIYTKTFISRHLPLPTLRAIIIAIAVI